MTKLAPVATKLLLISKFLIDVPINTENPPKPTINPANIIIFDTCIIFPN